MSCSKSLFVAAMMRTLTVTTRDDPSGAAALAEAMANLGSLADVVWFTNNLPYAERIE